VTSLNAVSSDLRKKYSIIIIIIIIIIYYVGKKSNIVDEKISRIVLELDV
jgi:hypothetical protein